MRRIDMDPTHELNGIKYRAGHVFPFGASVIENGIHFSVFSRDATGCTLVLYHLGEPQPYAEIPFPEEFRIGNVYSMIVFDLNIETTEYGYRFDGPWDLDAYGPGLCFASFWAEDHVRFGTQEDCYLYVAVNAHWEEHRFTFPVVAKGFGWHLAFSSDGFSCDPGEEKPWQEDGITLGARTSAVLIAKKYNNNTAL